MAAEDFDRDERIAHLLDEMHRQDSTIRDAQTLWQTHPDVADEVLRLASFEARLRDAVSDWEQAASDETLSLAALGADSDTRGGPHGPKVALALGQVGRYRIVQLLGEGGMGSVFAADDPQLQRRVAIKLPHFTGAPDQQEHAGQRFLREARSAAAVEHVNVCPIHDVGEHAGRPFVVMALIEGESLRQRLRRQPPLEVRAAVDLAVKIAAGLAAVHAHGIVHRDLKPGNILLRRKDGEPVLTDFGLAHITHNTDNLTADGMILGTPAYMSPEQVDPTLGAVTLRSDLYSLGAVLFEMTTGRRPYEGTLMQIIAQLNAGKPPSASQFRTDLDPALDAIIGRALARRPIDRFADAAEFSAALHAWLEGTPLATVELPRSLVQDTIVRPATSHRTVSLVAIAAGILLLGSLGVYSLRNGRRPAPINPPGQAVVAANPPLPSQSPLQGAIDVRVWRKDDYNPATRQLKHEGWKLNHPAALPLAPKDWMRIEVQLNRPAYCYVVWIDTEGHVSPLYPWLDMDWALRPPTEQPVQFLSLPDAPGSIAPLGPGPAGMETLLLLTRDEPLPSELDLVEAIGELPPQNASDMRSAVWFQNGDVVRNELDRGPIRLDQAQTLDDPILQTQAVFRDKLKGIFGYSRAVSFSNRGDQ